MQSEDPDFYEQVVKGKFNLPSVDETADEDNVSDDAFDNAPFDDDSSIPVQDAVDCLISGRFEEGTLTVGSEGNFESTACAETTANEEGFEQEDYFAVLTDGGRGKQVKKTSKDLVWKMENFWRHQLV